MTPEDHERLIAEIIEPEEIIEARKVLNSAIKLVESGEVECVSVYLQRRDDTYQTLQSQAPSRLYNAGMLLEMACERLGFVSRSDVQAMIDEAIK